MTDKNFKKGDIIRITERGDMICDHKIDPKKHLWVVDEECKSRPHGNPIYGIFTLDKDGDLYESASFPYAMELVEFPTSEEQELAWHIKSALDKSREKIKLEDMTLRQIGELKCYMANDIRKTITDIVCKYNESHDCGDIDISIDTDIREFRTEIGEKFAPSNIRYDIRIKFSKEDE